MAFLRLSCSIFSSLLPIYSLKSGILKLKSFKSSFKLSAKLSNLSSKMRLLSLNKSIKKSLIALFAIAKSKSLSAFCFLVLLYFTSFITLSAILLEIALISFWVLIFSSWREFVIFAIFCSLSFRASSSWLACAFSFDISSFALAPLAFSALSSLSNSEKSVPAISPSSFL